jgi:hypothetical protein
MPARAALPAARRSLQVLGAFAGRKTRAPLGGLPRDLAGVARGSTIRGRVKVALSIKKISLISLLKGRLFILPF